MKIAIIAPGLHRVQRGAEISFEAIGRELAKLPNTQVTLFGSGQVREQEPYGFIRVSNLSRENFERWPSVPILRDEYAYEELTFLLNLVRSYNPREFDITITCSYPFANWWLRRGQYHPVHIYVTQNGDYPAQSNCSEYRWFGCDGLICTNQMYFDRNKDLWPSALIPNGVDAECFSPGVVNRARFALPDQVPIALMVSALIPSKRVLQGIEAVSRISDLHLVICGDGPQRTQVHSLGQALMPGRMHVRQLPFERMPDIYKVADVFLHMSLDEPFGNVYLEALATGLPIVAHDRDVTRWILEDTSVLVDSRDAKATTAGILQALMQQSPAAVTRRRNLVNRRFAWPAIGQQYFDFLQAALSVKQNM